MKGKKKYLIVVLLLLLFGCGSFVTYSIYRTTLTGTGTINTATWAVQVNKGATEDVQNLDFSTSEVNWTTNPGKNGKIAPGATGTITYTIDATGSEVDVYYEASVGSNLPSGFTVTPSPASGTIAYSTEANAMVQNIVFTVTWNGSVSQDDATKDGTDIGMAGNNQSIPITLSVRQAA